MALTYPYPLAFFSDILHAGDVTFDLQRNDEMSGSGDARYWTAELARPLWSADIPLQPLPKPEARAINAKVRGLDGTSKAFLVADPSYDGPAAGEQGLSGATVTVNGVRGTDRMALAITGLPIPFTLTPGDYVTIRGGSGQVYFGMFVEGATSTGGTIGQREVRPAIPHWVSSGDPVELVQPYFKAIIPPGGFRPYRMNLGDYGAGASISILQKLP